MAGGDIAIQSDGFSFTRLEDSELFPTQDGDIEVSGIIAIARTSSGFDHSAAVWESPDGISWDEVEALASSVGSALYADEDEAVIAVHGGSKFFLDPVYLSSDDGTGYWTTTALDIPAQANRLLPTDAVRGPAGSTLISGSQLIDTGPTTTDTRNKPLFLIVEADRTSREALLTSSPVDSELNGNVNCMSGVRASWIKHRRHI